MLEGPSFDQLRALLQPLEAMPSDTARGVLLDDTAPAALLYVAARAFYGPTVATYDPDTLWALLDAPMINRDKLLAALTLQVNPQFYWDIRIFGHTCLAFNDQAAHTELVPHPLPEHLAAALFEAQLIFQLDTEAVPVFDDEVAAYVAACLAHEGLVYAPPLMSFAEQHLERLLSAEGRQLSLAMKKIAGEAHPEVDTESALGVQLARYKQVGAYVIARHMDLAARIAAIS